MFRITQSMYNLHDVYLAPSHVRFTGIGITHVHCLNCNKRQKQRYTLEQGHTHGRRRTRGNATVYEVLGDRKHLLRITHVAERNYSISLR